MLIILYRKILQTDLEKKREKKIRQLRGNRQAGAKELPSGLIQQIG